MQIYAAVSFAFAIGLEIIIGVKYDDNTEVYQWKVQFLCNPKTRYFWK